MNETEVLDWTILRAERRSIELREDIERYGRELSQVNSELVHLKNIRTNWAPRLEQRTPGDAVAEAVEYRVKQRIMQLESAIKDLAKVVDDLIKLGGASVTDSDLLIIDRVKKLVQP